MPTVRFVVVLFCGFALWATPTPCLAADAGGAEPPTAVPQAAPAAVSFADDRPLALELETPNDRDRLSVVLHNGLGRSQTLRLRVLGLDRAGYAGIRALFAAKAAVAEDVAPGRTARLELALRESPKPAPKPGETYELVLVALGERGALARLPLSIGVPAAKDPESEGVVLQPERPVDLTFTAVNYVPSPLTAFNSFLLLVAAFLLAAAIVLFRSPNLVSKRLPATLAILAVVCATAALGLASNHGSWDEPSPAAISERPIPVSGTAKAETVGAAASKDGRIVDLVVDEVEGKVDREMKPEGLESAAAYEGTYDFTPGKEGGSAKASVNVRDFWLYAFLVIGAGIVLGYLLHRWFTVGRPRARLEGQMALLRRQYALGTAIHDDQDRDSPYAGHSIDTRLDRRLAKIGRLLHDPGDFKAAGEELEKLGAYVEQFLDLRIALESLDNGCEQLAQVRRLLLELDVPADEDRRGFWSRKSPFEAAAAELLAREIDGPDADADAAKLVALRKAVDESQLALSTLHERLLKLGERVVEARDGLERANSAQRVRLEALAGEFLGLARQALRIEDVKKIEEIAAGERKPAGELERLLAEIGGAEAAPGDLLSFEAADPGEEYFARSASATFNFLYGKAPGARAAERRPPEPPKVAVEWRLPGEEEAETGKVHLEDLVLVEIRIESAEPLSFRTVEIDFGDGERLRRELPVTAGARTVTVRMSHLYRRSGKLTIAVRSGADQPPATTALEVDARTRVAHLETKLSETDRVVTPIAFALAIGSGLTLLYFANESWGEPGDYLAALIWGGATSEGVKLAARIADRTSLSGN